MNERKALNKPPERGKQPVVRVGTMLLAGIGLYPQYTAIMTVLMVFGVIQVAIPGGRLLCTGKCNHLS